MALFLVFDKKHQNPSGMIPLKRGDDWKLTGKIVEKYAKYEKEVDLTGASATGFFQAADAADTDKVIDVAVQMVNAECGQVKVELAASGTSLVALDEAGTSMYMTVSHPTLGLVTIETEAPILEIKDRGFIES